MRGVSARSLDEVLSAAEDLAAEHHGLYDELFAIASMLDNAPALRRVLSDPTVEFDTRSQLVNTLVADRISQAATSVLNTGVRRRWSSGRDLSDAIELAGVSALVFAGQDINLLEDELFELGRVVRSDAGLRQALSDRTVAFEPKANLLETVFGSKVSEATLALAGQALHARTGSFEKSLAAFADIAAQRQGLQLADVRVAHRLTDADRARLADTLSEQFGTRLHLNIIVDPHVIGGMSVSIGSQVYDGTMSSRLESARRRLAG